MNRILAAILVFSIGMATGCNAKKPAAPAANGTNQTNSIQGALAAGGTLNSDGSVTNANGSVTEPNGTVVPANAGPKNPGASPVAANGQTGATGVAPAGLAPSGTPAPIVREVTAPAGTAVTIRTNGEISSKADPDGSHFTGVLERPVVSHGETVFERGTPVEGVVVSSKNKGQFAGAGDLDLVLTAIGHHEVHTSEYVQVDKGRGKRTGAFIGGGAGLGALIGGIAGHGKGALIGGLAGAGAGTAASTTGSKDVVIRPESVITFRLREAVSR
jgi:hypothetical protein